MPFFSAPAWQTGTIPVHTSSPKPTAEYPQTYETLLGGARGSVLMIICTPLPPTFICGLTGCASERTETRLQAAVRSLPPSAPNTPNPYSSTGRKRERERETHTHIHREGERAQELGEEQREKKRKEERNIDTNCTHGWNLVRGNFTCF